MEQCNNYDTSSGCSKHKKAQILTHLVNFSGSELSPDNEGEMTPVNTGHTFDDFYHQSNPSAQSWQDENATTPTPGIQEVIIIVYYTASSKNVEY